MLSLMSSIVMQLLYYANTESESIFLD